jgi:hypothetical protein
VFPDPDPHPLHQPIAYAEKMLRDQQQAAGASARSAPVSTSVPYRDTDAELVASGPVRLQDVPDPMERLVRGVWRLRDRCTDMETRAATRCVWPLVPELHHHAARPTSGLYPPNWDSSEVAAWFAARARTAGVPTSATESRVQTRRSLGFTRVRWGAPEPVWEFPLPPEVQRNFSYPRSPLVIFADGSRGDPREFQRYHLVQMAELLSLR